jgi:hypothetical protein
MLGVVGTNPQFWSLSPLACLPVRLLELFGCVPSSHARPLKLQCLIENCCHESFLCTAIGVPDRPLKSRTSQTLQLLLHLIVPAASWLSISTNIIDVCSVQHSL